MKKIILVFILISSSIKIFACDCLTPEPAIEFHAAKYVFKAKVISKKYSSDSLTYEAKFSIIEHFKNGNNKLNKFKLTFDSEYEYGGYADSCSFNVNTGETWLIYGSLRDEIISFSPNCSNSKNIEEDKISNQEQKVLDLGNNFNIKNYVLDRFDVNISKPKLLNNTILDSVIYVLNSRNYKTKTTSITLITEINNMGHLISVNLAPKNYWQEYFKGKQPIKNSTFNLIEKGKQKYLKPKNQLETDLLHLFKSLSYWEKPYIIKTHEYINIIRYFTININDNKEINITYR